MNRLRAASLVYLATPYSKYPAGIEQAFVDAARLAAWLMREGVKVYSPIAHAHPLAIHGKLDPLDHAIWLPFDQATMDASHALLVAQMDGWRESKGITHEIGYFTKAGKSVFYLRLLTMFVSEIPHIDQ